MNIDKKKCAEAVKSGTAFGFIPHRLEIAWKPELNDFPFNVLFASHGTKDEQIVYGSATYEPDFHTYKKDGHSSHMRYHNIYGGDCYLTITYNNKQKSYRGKKFVNGELVGQAIGGDWKQFFTHFTMLGLKTNEVCKFEPSELESDH